jgi:ankyrin repeat protein
VAARNGHEAVVRLLLETGMADVESKDNYCQTPLSMAARYGHEAVVQLLFVESKNRYSWTPLSGRVQNGMEPSLSC